MIGTWRGSVIRRSARHHSSDTRSICRGAREGSTTDKARAHVFAYWMRRRESRSSTLPIGRMSLGKIEAAKGDRGAAGYAGRGEDFVLSLPAKLPKT